ncbi:MAG: RNA pseudouridine synthase [Gammaproteobacteria bacterium]|nr:RNA pseudouridine synthase [Gammaproteobacteria bacterium]
MKFEKHIEINESQTTLECLSNNTELSKQQLKKVMQNGAVWLESKYGVNRVRRAKKLLNKGEFLHIYYDAEIHDSSPPEAFLISDEVDYSIWNKPGGMYSQGTKWGDQHAIYRWAEQHLSPQRPAFIVHRLDKAANGLIIIAHKKKVAAKFSKMFELHEINKKYQAVVEGLIENIKLPYEIKNELDGKISISEILAISKDEKKQQTVVEIKIKTGRKHQIRRHLSGLGYPIVGDRLYGAKNTDLNLQLSSVELEFMCPTRLERVKYQLK